MWFSPPKGVPNNVFWGKWSCWALREHFKWCFLVWWRSSHSYFVYSQSLFLYKVGLMEVKENDFQDTPHDKRQKNSSIRNLLTKKCEKKQNWWTSSSKNVENYILGQNSDFREKYGILELEMSHPEWKFQDGIFPSD